MAEVEARWFSRTGLRTGASLEEGEAKGGRSSVRDTLPALIAVQAGVERMLYYLEETTGVEIDQWGVEERLLEAIYADDRVLALAAAK